MDRPIIDRELLNTAQAASQCAGCRECPGFMCNKTGSSSPILHTHDSSDDLELTVIPRILQTVRSSGSWPINCPRSPINSL